MHKEPLDFIHNVGSEFLARAHVPNEKALRAWRPSGLLWPMLRDIQGRALGLRKRTRIIDGKRVVWLQGGNPKGTPVVLLHGFGASKENWLTLLPLLTQRYSLYVPDLPGWGESHFCYDKTYSIDAQVERVAEWMSAVLPGHAHLVGSSMGGTIAALVAARHPDLLCSLTLMNAAGVQGAVMSPFEKALLRGKNTLVAQSTLDVAKVIQAVTHRNKAVLTATLTPLMSQMMVPRKKVNQHMFIQLMQSPPSQSQPSIKDIQTPTLIMWGDRDRIIDVSCVETFAQLIPHAEIKLLRDVGHLPMLEVPSLTSRCLRRFWRAYNITNKKTNIAA